VVRDGEVLRILSQAGVADWHALAESKLLAAGDRRIVGSELVEDVDGLPELPGGPPAGVLRHERIPFLSYPYEWTFGMLKDAALLQLGLMRDALEEGMILKDATPYNIQFRGPEPVFIDVGSFERLRDGEPWAGYRQFCMQFLFPLMLTAYKGLPHQPLMRGRLDGVSAEECRSMLSFRDRFRRGTTTHVFLHARLERKKVETTRDVKSELRKAGFKTELIKANVARLDKLVRRLDWQVRESTWSEYGATTSYTEEGAEEKARFVREVVETRDWHRVWDLGCNTGRFSRIAAERADHVVAVDFDAETVEGMYRALRSEGIRNILPMTMSLSDPSPSLGWRGAERPRLEERGDPDLILCLALVHHVTITDNVPVADFVRWLAERGSELIIEFVDREDPMAATLLSRKAPGSNPDYERDNFERCLEEHFTIARRINVPPGTRTLFHAQPRGDLPPRT
jgi:SAM-dependent methyltransferase